MDEAYVCASCGTLNQELGKCRRCGKDVTKELTEFRDFEDVKLTVTSSVAQQIAKKRKDIEQILESGSDAGGPE